MSCWKKKYGIAKDWNSTSQPAFNMPFENHHVPENGMNG
jgi:hypothetical protein